MSDTTHLGNQARLSAVLLLGLVALLISVTYYLRFFELRGYLPFPFVLDKSDTFMDLYNTIWNGYGDGRYTTWLSIYPPLNFLIVECLRILYFPHGVLESPQALRSTNLGPAIIISALHVVGPFFVVANRDWRRFSPFNRLLIAMIAVLSPALLFSMERGNILILPFFLLPFLFSRSDSVWKPICVAIIINLKPYFALLLFGYLIVGDWRRFLQATAIAGAIFIFTGLALDPNFPLFLSNLLSFAGNEAVFSGREVLALPASPSAFSYAINIFIKTSTNPSLYADWLPVIPKFVELIKWGILLTALMTMLWNRRSLRVEEAFTALLLIAVTAGVWAGGYSQIFYLPTVPVLARMKMRRVHLSILLAIFMPWDLIRLHLDGPYYMFSFLSGKIVDVYWQLGMGTFARPSLNMLLLLSLTTELSVRQSKRQAITSSKSKVSVEMTPDAGIPRMAKHPLGAP